MSSSKPSSRVTDNICGDCGSLDPAWAIVNRGILVCDECCSVHRSLGRHISQVKSLKKSSWYQSQLAMVMSLNSSGVNSLWEQTLSDSKVRRKPTPKEPVHPNKAEFIKAKHRDLMFLLKKNGSQEELNQELHASVRSNNLETSLRLLAHGADSNYLYEEKGNRPLHVAAKAGQLHQVELLLAYGADPCVKDSDGNTPGMCARSGCHRDVHLRLIEAAYEVTDRLIYFLTKQKPNHIASKQHFYVPEARDCLVKPQSPPGNAIAKLRQLSNTQFEILAMDVYDEVDRRETENIWQLSGASLEHGTVPFLPVNSDYSSMRNQGRQKLGTLSPMDFTSIVLNILSEAKKRQFAGLEHINGKGLKDSDDEPLYDSVASDEDYATAEQLAIMVAQNARGERLNISEVNSSKTVSKCEPDCAFTSSIEDLRDQLALSRGQISQLNLQIHKLYNKVNEVTQENKELRVALQTGNISGRREVVRSGSMAAADQASSSHQLEAARRPVSMYETRDTHQVVNHSGGMPSREEVSCKCEQVTKRLQILWSGVRPHTSFSADSIVSAVSHLSSLFPQRPQEEEIKSALHQLNTNVIKLQAECGTLEKTSEQVRDSALNMATAIKNLLTFFQAERQSP